MALRDRVFAGVAAAALTVSNLAPNFALAQDSTAMGRTAPSTTSSVSLTPQQARSEAWMKAQDHSLAHPVVTFALYGRTQKATSQEVATKVQALLTAKGAQNSVYFTQDENRIGVAVAFFIEGVQYGPYNIQEAVPAIETVAGVYKENLQRVASTTTPSIALARD